MRHLTFAVWACSLLFVTSASAQEQTAINVFLPLPDGSKATVIFIHDPEPADSKEANQRYYHARHAEAHLGLVLGDDGQQRYLFSSGPDGYFDFDYKAGAWQRPAGIFNAKALPADDLESLLTTLEKSPRVEVDITVGAPFTPMGDLSKSNQGSRKFAYRIVQRQVMDALTGLDHEVTSRHRSIPGMTIAVSREALLKLVSLPQVVRIEPPMMTRSLGSQPTTSRYLHRQWTGVDECVEEHSQTPAAFEACDPPDRSLAVQAATTLRRTGRDQAVVIIDNGLDKSDSCFASDPLRIVAEACFSRAGLCPGGATTAFGRDSAVKPPSTINHGVPIADVLACNEGPGEDPRQDGVAPGAWLIPIQVYSGSNTAFNSDIIDALNYVHDELARRWPIAAINISLGNSNKEFSGYCDDESPNYRAAIENLRSIGAATVIASGNSNKRDVIEFPACYSAAISVGELRVGTAFRNNTIGSQLTGVEEVATYIGGGSNVSATMDLIAPNFDIANGTSFSAPFVAGAIALIRERNPTGSVEELRTALRDTAQIFMDNRSGGIHNVRRIRVDEALLAARGPSGGRRLTVNIDGPGRVTSLPGRIDCLMTGGSFCRATVQSGSFIRLTAEALEGASFAGWSGCELIADFGAELATVRVFESTTCTASFSTSTPSFVEITVVGPGQVSSDPEGIDCSAFGGMCTAEFDQGTDVMLNATPTGDAVFDGWSGDPGCGSTVQPLPETLSCTATFSERFMVSVVKIGAGSVSSVPAGIDCGGECSASFSDGEVVTLTATPDEGWTFDAWTGCPQTMGNTCAVTVTDDFEITANFVEEGPATETLLTSGFEAGEGRPAKQP